MVNTFLIVVLAWVQQLPMYYTIAIFALPFSASKKTGDVLEETWIGHDRANLGLQPLQSVLFIRIVQLFLYSLQNMKFSNVITSLGCLYVQNYYWVFLDELFFCLQNAENCRKCVRLLSLYIYIVLLPHGRIFAWDLLYLSSVQNIISC